MSSISVAGVLTSPLFASKTKITYCCKWWTGEDTSHGGKKELENS